MKWVSLLCSLLLVFTGCAVRVVVEPLKKQTPRKYSKYHKKSKKGSKPKPKPTPEPTPSPYPLTSPLPPDPRIEDILRTLKDDR